MYFPFANYPYMDWHSINLDWILTTIKELKTKVDSMDMETLLARLTQVETGLTTLSGTVNTLGNQVSINEEAIRGINRTLDEALMDIGSLKTRLTNDETTISEIQTALSNIGTILEPIEADITALTSQVSALDGRVTALESATFESPTESNFNMFVGDMVNLNSLDYSIVEVTNNGQSTNNIRVNSDLIRFYHSSSNNEMALVIHNVLPYYGGNPYTGKVFSFANRYKTSGSSNGIDYCINVPFSSLTGNTPYIANSGYTATRATMRVLQLKRSTTDNNFYDLWIYNRYQGQYGILTGADVDILNLVMVMRELDATQSTDTIKGYFITELNSIGKQIARVVDKKAPGIISSASQIASQYDETVLQDAKDYADIMDSGVAQTASFDLQDTVDEMILHEPGVNTVTIQPIPNLNSDVTVDYSNCKASHKVLSIPATPEYETWTEEIDIFISVKITITGSGAVNLGGSYTPVCEFVNSHSSAPAEKIALTAHHNLTDPSKPVYLDVFYDTVNKLKFRLNFDDTGYDYTNKPIEIFVNGFVPLTYVVTAP